MDVKLGEKVFGYPEVELVVGVGIPYGRRVLDDIHDIRKKSSRRHDNKVGG